MTHGDLLVEIRVLEVIDIVVDEARAVGAHLGAVGADKEPEDNRATMIRRLEMTEELLEQLRESQIAINL